jgi:hypothetical protein
LVIISHDSSLYIYSDVLEIDLVTIKPSCGKAGLKLLYRETDRVPSYISTFNGRKKN